jgi:hypothetical protein
VIFCHYIKYQAVTDNINFLGIGVKVSFRNIDLSFEATSDPQLLSALKHISETSSQRSCSLPVSNDLTSRKFETYSYIF